MINIYFFSIAIPSLTVAFALQAVISGPNMKTYQFWLTTLFNFTFACFYINLVNHGCLAFYKCFTSLEEEHPIIVWAALISTILHGIATPKYWKPRYCLRRRKPG